jgi:hypothetical protein
LTFFRIRPANDEDGRACVRALYIEERKTDRGRTGRGRWAPPPPLPACVPFTSKRERRTADGQGGVGGPRLRPSLQSPPPGRCGVRPTHVTGGDRQEAGSQLFAQHNKRRQAGRRVD